MKMMKVFYLVVVFTVSVLVLSAVNVQAVSEEARRHMARGEAAVEMAKSPEDYEQAIKEFQEAARLEPIWAAPYYSLGLVQEKAGKFREAIASLNRYLQLAPNAPDASKVKELVYKLEYKAERENILTIADIVDILVSLGDKEMWERETRAGFDASGFNITRVGNDRIKVPRMNFYDGRQDRLVVAEPEGFNIINIKGPVVRFVITYSFCGYPPDCPGWNRSHNTLEHEIQVVSKTYVKVKTIPHPKAGGIQVKEYRKR